jgi:hypothetical protein
MKSEKTEETKADPTCKVDGCQDLPLIDGHCAAHWAADKAVNFTRTGFEDGDWMNVALGVVGIVTAQASQPMIQRITEDMAKAAHGRPVQNPFRSPFSAPPKPPPMNPWPILGLDPKVATSEDVKAMQRRLAELYHPDKAVKGVSDDALKVVNQAADLALGYLKSQGR